MFLFQLSCRRLIHGVFTDSQRSRKREKWSRRLRETRAEAGRPTVTKILGTDTEIESVTEAIDIETGLLFNEIHTCLELWLRLMDVENIVWTVGLLTGTATVEGAGTETTTRGNSESLRSDRNETGDAAGTVGSQSITAYRPRTWCTHTRSVQVTG